MNNPCFVGPPSLVSPNLKVKWLFEAMAIIEWPALPMGFPPLLLRNVEEIQHLRTPSKWMFLWLHGKVLKNYRFPGGGSTAWKPSFGLCVFLEALKSNNVKILVKNSKMMCWVSSGSACVQVIDIFLFKPFLRQEAGAIQGGRSLLFHRMC